MLMYLAVENTTQELIRGNVLFIVKQIPVNIKCNVKVTGNVSIDV